jgi:hypothetical protein
MWWPGSAAACSTELRLPLCSSAEERHEPSKNGAVLRPVERADELQGVASCKLQVVAGVLQLAWLAGVSGASLSSPLLLVGTCCCSSKTQDRLSNKRLVQEFVVIHTMSCKHLQSNPYLAAPLKRLQCCTCTAGAATAGCCPRCLLIADFLKYIHSMYCINSSIV